MQLDSVQDSTRYVVEGLHHGSIMPGKREEMKRDVFLQAGAEVRGGIWAHTLAVHGGGIHVEDSIYCLGSIRVGRGEGTRKRQAREEPLVFESTVSTADSLLVDDVSFRCRFGSDIYAGSIQLNNAIVMGNIFARNVRLNNSIVLGGVFCEQNLFVQNSMVTTFRARNAQLEGDCYLFFPFALAEGPMTIGASVRAVSFARINPSEAGTAVGQGVIQLDEDDVFELRQSEEAGAPKDSRRSLYCLSAAERILDAQALGAHFQYNRRFLEQLSLSRHMDHRDREKTLDKPLATLEEHLWTLLQEGKEHAPVRGASNLNDLHQTFRNGAEPRKV